MYLGSQLFTDAEYAQRLLRVRELMERQGLSAAAPVGIIGTIAG